MATQKERIARTPTRPRVQDPDHQLPPGRGDGEAPRRGIGELIRDLADDTRTLIRQEIDLAKMEVSRTVKGFALDGVWIAVGSLVAALGVICLVLAMALGLGELLDSHWLGTLITGTFLLLLAGLVIWKGARGMSRRDPRPTRTIASLREDADWAKQELDEFRTELSGSHHDRS